jgi:hypothetical protein
VPEAPTPTDHLERAGSTGTVNDMYADYLDPMVDPASSAAAGNCDDAVGPAGAVMDSDSYQGSR